MNLLLFKLITVPLLTLLVSWVQKRFSHHLGGLVSGLPVTVGPILVFLALEQGQEFARNAAITAMSGHFCIAFFAIAYLVTARRFGWKATLAIAIGVWLATFFVMTQIKTTPLMAVGISAAAILTHLWYARRQRVTPERLAHIPYELPVRSVVTLVPLLVITGIASLIGPQYSGLLSVFPVMWSVVFSFTFARSGRNAVAIFVRGATFGQFGFFVFYVLLIFVDAPNLWSWFGLAVAGALATSSIANAARDSLMPDRHPTDLEETPPLLF